MTRPVTAAPLCAPGEAEKPCILSLVDDTLYEEGEELRLVLGNPRSEWRLGGSVGAPNETVVQIRDTADSESMRSAAGHGSAPLIMLLSIPHQ